MEQIKAVLIRGAGGGGGIESSAYFRSVESTFTWERPERRRSTGKRHLKIGQGLFHSFFS